MKTVTARFMTVAMVQGSVVGAALWGMTLIWPVVWGYIKTHVASWESGDEQRPVYLYRATR
jgi:hypothetical protein